MQLSAKHPLPHPSPSLRGVRPQYFYIALAIFAFEEIINARLGVALSVPIVLLVLMILRSGLLVTKGVPLGTANAIAVVALIVLYQVPSVLAAPDDCTVNAKFLATTLTFIFAIWSMWWLRLEQSIFSPAGSKLLLRVIIGSVILSLIGFDVMAILGNEPRIGSGFYSEPSHLALHIVPLIAYRLLNNFSDRLTWIALALVLAFAPSTTLAVGLFGVVAMKLSMKIRSKWVVIAVITLAMGVIGVLASQVSNNSMLDRISGIINFDESQITNLSAPVWLNGWSQAIDHLIASKGWGVGFNQMGCGALNMAGYLSPLLLRGEGTVVNSTDGSFLFAKIVAELGLLGLLVCIYLSYLAINAMLTLRRAVFTARTSAAVRNDMICRAAAGLTLLVYLYVRGMSYFAFPSMLAVALLLRRPVQARKHIKSL